MQKQTAPADFAATSTAALARLVGELARRVGLAIDDDEVFRRVEPLGDIVDDAVRLDAAAEAAGLRLVRQRRTVKSLRDTRVLPALARGAAGFVIVTAAHRVFDRFDIVDTDGDTRVVTAAEVAALVGGDLVEWCIAEPALPLADLHSDDHGSASALARLRVLWRLERTDVGVVVAYGVAVALISLATPLAVQALVSSVAFGNLLQPLLVLSIVVVIALSLGGVLRTLQLWVVEVLQRRLFVRLVADLAWRLPRVTHGARDEVDGAKHVNRFFDVLTVQKATATLLLDGVVLVLELVVGLAVLSVYSNTLMVFAIALIAGVAFIVFGLGRHGISTSIDESYAKHDVAGWLEELVRHPTAFRGGNARNFGVDRAEAFARAYVGTRSSHFKILLRQSVGGFALQAIASAVLLGVGGALVIAGTLTLGQLVAAELIVGAIVAALSKLGKQLEVAYDLFAAVDKIGHLVDLDVERVGGAAVRVDGGLGISANDVAVTMGDHTFSFGTFSLKAGSQVAIIGDSGAGKSLFVDALLGLRMLSAGRLSVDGDDIRDLSLESLRSRVGLCRDVEIFDGSVAENLRIGRHELRTRELVEALRLVELDESLLSRREGLSSMLVHGSGLLSKGQGRRLMLARALLGEPGLVVVDGSLDGLELPLLRRLVPRVKKRLDDVGATLIVTTCRPDVAALFDRTLTLTPAGVVATEAR